MNSVYQAFISTSAKYEGLGTRLETVLVRPVVELAFRLFLVAYYLHIIWWKTTTANGYVFLLHLYTQLIWFSTIIIHSHKSYSVLVIIVTQLCQLILYLY